MKMKHLLFAVTAAGMTLAVTNLGPAEPAQAGITVSHRRLAYIGDGLTDRAWSTDQTGYPASGVTIVIGSGTDPNTPHSPSLVWPASGCGTAPSTDRKLFEASVSNVMGVPANDFAYFELSILTDYTDSGGAEVFKGPVSETVLCCMSITPATPTTLAQGVFVSTCPANSNGGVFRVYAGSMERL